MSKKKILVMIAWYLPSTEVDKTFPWRASRLSLRGKPTPILSAAAVGTDIDLVADPLHNTSITVYHSSTPYNFISLLDIQHSNRNCNYYAMYNVFTITTRCTALLLLLRDVQSVFNYRTISTMKLWKLIEHWS